MVHIVLYISIELMEAERADSLQRQQIAHLAAGLPLPSNRPAGI